VSALPAERDPLAELLVAGGEPLQDALAASERRLREVAEQAGPPLDRPARETIDAGGKRLRPLLVALSALATGTLDGPHVVPAAVAVELVHSATLVHDDIIDRAPLRRGRPTVAAAYGRREAIALGDLLFARAFSELAGTGELAALAVLAGASRALARGELLQREDAWDPTLATERYAERCELKTAALFEAACRLGALPAGAAADALADFARRIGVAFQILDDVLDIEGPEERTGKTPGTDLLDGTVTLPFLLARDADESLARLDQRALRRGPELEALCAQIAQTGALGEARERALALVAAAKRELPAELDEHGATLLRLVADAVVARYS
jgi:geranylgeranyl pyrophosphate synthase